MPTITMTSNGGVSRRSLSRAAAWTVPVVAVAVAAPAIAASVPDCGQADLLTLTASIELVCGDGRGSYRRDTEPADVRLERCATVLFRTTIRNTGPAELPAGATFQVNAPSAVGQDEVSDEAPDDEHDGSGHGGGGHDDEGHDDDDRDDYRRRGGDHDGDGGDGGDRDDDGGDDGSGGHHSAGHSCDPDGGNIWESVEIVENCDEIGYRYLRDDHYVVAVDDSTWFVPVYELTTPLEAGRSFSLVWKATAASSNLLGESGGSLNYASSFMTGARAASAQCDGSTAATEASLPIVLTNC